MLGDTAGLIYTKPEDLYHRFGGRLKTVDDGHGTTFKSLEEWISYPHKESIIKQVEDVRKSLRVRSSRWWLSTRSEAGMSPGGAITPICNYDSVHISFLVRDIRNDIYGLNEYNITNIPQKFVKTDIGYALAKDLSSIKSFSRLVFCHTFMRYDSLIVDGDRLISIINWKYAEYYSVEFEEVIRKYIEYI